MKRVLLFLLAVLMVFSVCACKKTQTYANTTILASSESCVYIIGSDRYEILYSVLNSVDSEVFSDLSIEDLSYDEELFTQPGMHEITFPDNNGNLYEYPVCSVRKDWLIENADHIKTADTTNAPADPEESFGINKFVFTETVFGEVDRELIWDLSTNTCSLLQDDETTELSISQENADLAKQYLILADFGSWDDLYPYGIYIDADSKEHDGAWSITLTYADGHEREISGAGGNNVPQRGKYVNAAIALICPEYGEVTFTCL